MKNSRRRPAKELDTLCDNLWKTIGEAADLSDVNFAVIHGKHKKDLAECNMLLAVNDLLAFRTTQQGRIALTAYQTGLQGAVHVIASDPSEDPTEKAKDFFGDSKHLRLIYQKEGAECALV